MQVEVCIDFIYFLYHSNISSIAEATAVIMTFIVNNYDHLNDDPDIQESLAKARTWEAAFVSFTTLPHVN